MNINDIKQICVIGAGNMGHQIALRGALSGYKVICTDVSDEQLKKLKHLLTSICPVEWQKVN